ncbi:AbrB/MazE/SpoVT family DNA-binding domain-containing protein [Alcanivorax marinus]|uniref:AbrB/MazE/SpoVT family DNA-binding domain-containing protein n=1 Tax=Alloalcanivorax marinus TaxID=1177169 RepID=A0A9Q3YR67_9GAMM|nr:AbrB/MazE/SpoVT family DNA-binding domain-containing protein [Alloalcanivorax marinus]MCC4310530.1 AbrB/MazE/SpoVT family DNA-binding domain-containing protein [Alloalcanivorax marinus]
MVTRTKLVRLGNSRAVRIPKAILNQVGMTLGDVEIEVRGRELVIRPVATMTLSEMLKTVSPGDAALTVEDRDWFDAARAGNEVL